MAFFEWGVAVHDLDFEAIRKRQEAQEAGRATSSRRSATQGAPPDRQGLHRLPGAQRPAGLQEDAATANFTANIVRNVWSHAIIFCGHFPDQAYTFTEEEVEDETRGGWYVRQLLGAANIEGSPLFHLMSGNLGYQVEHHLYPDMPSSRYQEIAPRVRRSARRTASPTTPARSASSGDRCSARSSAWPSRAAGSARSPGPRRA